MAKRGYKLQEFVAHSSSINCLRIGRKACRFLLTGGDDKKLNLWAIGESSSLMSLCGHTSPVECAAFDSAEVLVLGGASSGTIKLWDLEEAKMVRTLNGHRLNCTAVEFHPFGEFFASGSADTDLKIWDIRKKGCIHTYKGHSLGINTIKFTPDGRWVVSGGFDNVVKVWDLTAGKLLHDFKFHDGYIRSLDFHPFEFLLATGSADRTVKFWDLETFEMIGSARAEATGVRAMAFHPDGRTLFCGYNDNLKVYSWEPVICHDTVDMGWSTLGDLCINEEKLIGCSYYQNSVGVWVADLSVIDPYGTATTPESKTHKELKPDSWDSPSMENDESAVKSTLGSRSTSPDLESKEIKNIYVDYEKPIRTRKVGSLNSPKVVSSPFDSKESNKVPTKKQSPVESTPGKSRQARNRSFVVPNIVPRDRSGGKDLARSRRESFTPAKTSANSSVKPSPTRRTSYSKYDLDRLYVSEQQSPNTTADPILSNKIAAEVGARDAFVDKHPNMTDVEEKIEDNVEHIASNLETASFPSNKPGGSLDAHIHAVKVVNGVAVVHGRTRSLVERFERRDATSSGEDLSAASPEVITDRIKTSTMQNEGPQVSGRDVASVSDDNVIEHLMQNHDSLLNSLRSRLTKIQVVRHFWERSDFRGAFNAIKKLPDHSVQADVISVLLEKMTIVTLDLFSILLPVLLSLLDSKTERHAKMSLEVLLKLVAVFGPTINSSMSAPPSVGVDLHQEQRIECCRECFYHLQKIRNSIPGLARRSGLLARSAQELNLVLQDHNIA